jgi:hypothetical protein
MFLVAGLIGAVLTAVGGSGVVFHPEILARVGAPAGIFLLGVGIMCAGTAACFIAWRKLGTGAKGARGWAIAASVSLILNGFSNPRGAIWWIAGVCGLIVFIFKRDAVSAAVVSKPVRMAGDGTSGVLDWVGTAVIYAGLIVGSSFWSAWARGHGLPPRGQLIERLAWVLIAGLIATGIHELGHALTAIALDMRVRRVLVGPFSANFQQGRWQFRFLPKEILSAGGAVGTIPATMEEYRWRQLLMCAAGPVASGALAAFGFAITLNLPGTAWEPYWLVCSYVATYSLLGFVVNLIPMQPEGMYSDGAKIYQLLAGGAPAKIEEAFASVSASLVGSVRPRDWNADLLAAAAGQCAGERAVLLRLFAVKAHFDAGRAEQAEMALKEAESFYLASAGATPRPLQQIVHESLTFYSVVIRRSAADARTWWNRTTWPRAEAWTSDALRSYAALLWLEGQTSEAEHAWAKGYAIAERCPKAGTYDYDRDCFVRLRESMAPVAA